MKLNHWTFVRKPTVINLGTSVEVPRDLTEYYEVSEEEILIHNGKFDVVLSRTISEREVDLVRKRGGVLGIEFEEFPSEQELKWTVTYAKKLLVAKKDEKLYFFLITKPPKFLEENYRKLLKFLEEKWENLKEKPPAVKVVRKTNPRLEVINRERAVEKATEISTEALREFLKKAEENSFEREALAPPKEGHLLLMVSAGLADGVYENKVIKGILTVDKEKFEEENKTVEVEVPKAVLRVLDLESLEFEEITEV